MTNRIYRLWGYTPSHAQLLIRSVADATHHLNEDLIFLGVNRLDVPERMVGLTVRAVDRAGDLTREIAIPGAAEEGDHVYILEATVGDQRKPVGFVVAESFVHEENQRDPYDSLLTPLQKSIPSGAAFERQVVAALSRIPGLAFSDRDVGVDALVSTDANTLIAIEVKHIDQANPRLTRNIVTQLVVALEQLPFAARGLVVLDNAEPEFLRELRAHLLTALNARGEALSWNLLQGVDPLREAISRLAA